MIRTIDVRCPECTWCGAAAILTVPSSGYRNWRSGMFIQNALPDLSPELREMLITGTHPKCWNEMFGGDE